MERNIATDGPYYAELDKETGLFCVFHCDTGKAHESYASEDEAEANAKERNDEFIARRRSLYRTAGELRAEIAKVEAELVEVENALAQLSEEARKDEDNDVVIQFNFLTNRLLPYLKVGLNNFPQ